MKNFEELLEEVLREDACAKPRTGLEGRVMARVRAEKEQSRGSVLQDLNRRRNWLFIPAAACLGIAAVVGYVAGDGMLQPDRIAIPAPAPASTVSSVEMPRPLAGSARNDGPKISERHLLAGGVGRQPKRVRAASPGGEPKLETFPAVSQKGDAAGWLGGSDGGKLAAIASEVTPAVAKAYRQLQEAQSEPIDIAAIEITPLQ